MGTPPSYFDFLHGPDTQPTVRALGIAALLERVEDLERTRAVDAARIGVLEAQLAALREAGLVP
jgi:hypothetical protein